MSLALKFSSLAIRTLSKPIANFIKKQAHEHTGFRQTCISFAQSLHRIDMRWRIGLLQDAAAVDRQAAREAAEEAAKRHKHNAPTVKTEAQTKADDAAAAKRKDSGSGSGETEKKRSKPKVKPLSEAKAIESGANFISETFLFGVAAGLIFFESWRSRRKEGSRRDEVADRLADLEDSERAARHALVELEREVLVLRASGKGTGQGKHADVRRILPREVYEASEEDERINEEVKKGWLGRIVGFMSRDTDTEATHAIERNTPGPAEEILRKGDKEIEERQKARAAEDAVNANATAKPS